jgi:hypothetical protein
MMPPTWVDALVHNRRRFLQLLLAAAGGLHLTGCTSRLLRGQSPDPEDYFDEELEKRVKLVGDITSTWGFHYQKVEGIALVTGLAGTGSDPPPSPQRQTLLSDMQSHDVENPNQVLASNETAMVVVRGYLPPGCQKGDRFDVELRIAPRTETTSLRSGWMMQSRLRETEMLGNSVRTGHILALAQGPVIVDAVFEGGNADVLETRGRVQNGGVATRDRLMGLVVKGDFNSVRTSSLVGTVVNSRFHTFDQNNVKIGLAKPKDDNYIELKLHPRYKHNIARYTRVVRAIALNENTADRAHRLMMLDRMILDSSTVANAALQLEAIGKDGIPILKKGLRSEDPEVRFYTAEALAYLDERESAPVLKEIVLSEPAFRWHAMAALTTIGHLDAYSALNELLHVPSAETRYGAFRALRTRNANDPLLAGKTFHQEYSLHAIPSTTEPMVHFTQSSKPEVVIFGDHIELLPTDFTYAGRNIVVKRIGERELRVSRFAPGTPDKVEVCSTKLDDCIRAVASVGGRYEDVLHLVHEAKRQNFLAGRVVVDALPQSSRLLEKQLEEVAQQEAQERRRAAHPLPEMFANRLAKDKSLPGEDEDAALVAAFEAEQEAALEEASKKKRGWSRLMWWK